MHQEHAAETLPATDGVFVRFFRGRVDSVALEEAIVLEDFVDGGGEPVDDDGDEQGKIVI